MGIAGVILDHPRGWSDALAWILFGLLSAGLIWRLRSDEIEQGRHHVDRVYVLIAHRTGVLGTRKAIGPGEHERVAVRVFTEKAWHSLFIRNLLIRPDGGALKSFVPKLTILDLPSFKANPDRHGTRTETVIACDFARGIILIGGTSYAG